MREPTDLDNLQADYGSKSGRPAWPVLLVVNVSLLLGLAGLAWRYLQSGSLADSKSQLNEMSWSDVLAAEQSVEMALQQAQSPRALQAKDHRVLASHMASVAMDSGLFWVGLEIEPGESINGVQTVMANVGIEGPPFRLPIFIEQLRDFPALGVVEQVEAQAVGPDTGLFQIQIAFSAPVLEDTEWIASATSGHETAVSTLEKAAGLQAWRLYSQGEAHREAQAIARADALVRAIPSGLWALSRESIGFMWTPTSGMQALGEPAMAPIQ